jgi:ABC-type transporter MlaC component
LSGIPFLCLVLVLLGVQAATPNGVQAAASPRSVVETDAQRVCTILDSRVSQDEILRRLQQVAYGSIDFDTVIRLVLGTHWGDLSKDQRKTFYEVFRRGLALRYSRLMACFGSETPLILREDLQSNGDVIVKTRTLAEGAKAAAVDYRLRQRDGAWYVVDISVRGESMVSGYRIQFLEFLRQGGPGRLLVELRLKNSSSGVTVDGSQ